MLSHMLRAAAGRAAPPANVTFVASTTQIEAAITSTTTITTPAGAQSGDYLIAILTIGTPTISTPAGWTLLASGLPAAGKTYAFGLLLTAAPAASYTFTASSTSRWASVMVAYSNVVNVSATAQNNTSSTNIVAPSVTFPVAGVLVCGFATESGTAITAPASMVSRGEALTSTYRTCEVADETVTSGASGTRTATSTADTNVGISIALRSS